MGQILSVWAINIIQEMQEDAQSQVSKSAKHQVIPGLTISVKGQAAWTAWPLKVGPIGRPEMSVSNYQSTPRHFSGMRRSQLHRGGSLKPQWTLRADNLRSQLCGCMVTATTKAEMTQMLTQALVFNLIVWAQLPGKFF